jgi:hypothetical protein
VSYASENPESDGGGRENGQSEATISEHDAQRFDDEDAVVASSRWRLFATRCSRALRLP